MTNPHIRFRTESDFDAIVKDAVLECEKYRLLYKECQNEAVLSLQMRCGVGKARPVKRAGSLFHEPRSDPIVELTRGLWSLLAATPIRCLNPDSIEMAEAPASAPKVARSIPLEHSAFYSVEYPGYVSPQSVPKAVERLGGPHNVTETFKRSLKIDLRLKDNDLFAHSPAGQTVTTHNLLMKVVRRKRKHPLDAAAASSTGADASESFGQFTAEVIGMTPKTIRFRSES